MSCYYCSCAFVRVPFLFVRYVFRCATVLSSLSSGEISDGVQLLSTNPIHQPVFDRFVARVVCFCGRLSFTYHEKY